MIDKNQVAQHFSAAAKSYDHEAFVQQQINRRLVQMLLQHGKKQFDRVLEIGCGTGGLTRLLNQNCEVVHWVLNDLYDSKRFDFLSQVEFISGDAETIDLDGDFNLIASASAVQWFERPSEILKKWAGLLVSDGLLLFSGFLPDNFCEVRAACGLGLDYFTAEQWQGWLEPYFDIKAFETAKYRLSFHHPREVLHHIRATGVGGVGAGCGNFRLAKFCRRYPKQDENSCELTYAPFYVLAEKKK